MHFKCRVHGVLIDKEKYYSASRIDYPRKDVFSHVASLNVGK